MPFDMSASSWELAAQVAQVVATVLTGIGVMVSLWLGIRSLRELEKDRTERLRPYLLFERGGFGIDAKIQPIHGILGIDPSSARPLLKGIIGRPSFVPNRDWGRLTNFGSGSALDADVQFLAYRVHIGEDSFPLESKRLSQFPYMLDINTIPLSPSHLLPASKGQLFRIPTPIVADVERKLSGIEFVMHIRCSDSAKNPFSVFQECTIWVEPHGQKGPPLLATFGDELTHQEARKRLGDAFNLLMPKESGEPRFSLRRMSKALVTR